FADRRELVETFRVVGRHDGLMVIHVRGQGDFWLEALDEAIQIAREGEVALHVSHLCALGPRNWGKLAAGLEKLADARADGLAVSFDQHPYTAGSTVLLQVLPPWATEGGTERLVERLRDPQVRRRIRDDLAGPPRVGGENFISLVGWEGIQVAGVASERNRACVGRTVA